MSKAPLVLLLLLAAAPEDDKKAPADPKPRISVALPLAISPGAAAQVTLRGQNLDQVGEVKLAPPVEGATLSLKSKGKAELPKESDPAAYGDTKVEIEIRLPSGFAAGTVGLVAVNPKGEAAYALEVLPPDRLIPEKEPNGGFATAQPVQAGQTVQGTIGQAMDVDVFKVEGKKGESWVFEVEAGRRGSVLDAILTLYDSAGHIVATADDSETARDPVIPVTLPKDGTYLVTLIDAHNSGDASHAYLLHLRRD